MSAKAEKGSDPERALGELQAKADAAERRAAFAEDAGRPEIGCINPRVAWMVAEAGAMFSKAGLPDWQAIRQAAPELFRRAAGSADGGAGNQQAPRLDMNATIRRGAAGRSG